MEHWELKKRSPSQLFRCHKCGSREKFHDCPGQNVDDLHLLKERSASFGAGDGDTEESDQSQVVHRQRKQKGRKIQLSTGKAKSPKGRKRKPHGDRMLDHHDSPRPLYQECSTDSELNLPQLGRDEETDASFTDNSSLASFQPQRSDPTSAQLPRKLKRPSTLTMSNKKRKQSLCSSCNIPLGNHVCPFEVHEGDKNSVKWTTTMAPVHMLQDHWHDYKHEYLDDDETEELAPKEERFLRDWVTLVSRKLINQNTLLAQNQLLVATQKQQTSAVRAIQDDLVELERKIRQGRSEKRAQEEEVRIRKRQDSTYNAACSFLRSLSEHS